jgi:hypothetical protein
MTTTQIPASDLRVGDMIHNNNHGRHEITRAFACGGRMTVQFDGIPGLGHTFRDDTAMVTIDSREG